MATEENAEPRSARYLTYSLLAGQHLLTLVTRIALPYIVAFISQEQQLSEQQRATLLSRDEDLGTLLNGKIVRTAPLANDDEVTVGPVTFRLVLRGPLDTQRS